MAVSDAFEESLVRGRATLMAILEEGGGVLTGEEAARRGVSVADGGVLVVPGDVPLYPALQFTDDGILPGMREVLADLGDILPMMKVLFFLTSQVGDFRPTDALRMGMIEEAREAARAFAAEK